MKKYILELIRVDIIEKLDKIPDFEDNLLDKYLTQLQVIDEILHDLLTKQNQLK